MAEAASRYLHRQGDERKKAPAIPLRQCTCTDDWGPGPPPPVRPHRFWAEPSIIAAPIIWRLRSWPFWTLWWTANPMGETTIRHTGPL